MTNSLIDEYGLATHHHRTALEAAQSVQSALRSFDEKKLVRLADEVADQYKRRRGAVVPRQLIIKSLVELRDGDAATFISKAGDPALNALTEWTSGRFSIAAELPRSTAIPRAPLIQRTLGLPPPATPRERALGGLFDWLAEPMQLQKVPSSILHRFDEFIKRKLPERRVELENAPHYHSFLITHNWAAAFAGAEEFSGEGFKLPAPNCCFEFRVSGRRVLACFHEDDGFYFLAIEFDGPEEFECYGWDHDLHTASGQDGAWARLVGYESDPEARAALIKLLEPLRKLVVGNVRAACIALEAEVAEAEVVRAPHRLNAARERRGKRPLSDYHVINLANRRRYAPLPAEMADHDHRNRPRLHFRRGHWRHYQNHKTYVKWTLVGDPELGWVDKDYRL